MKSNDLATNQNPAGYLHRLHTEYGVQVRYSDVRTSPFGRCGVDYDPSYTVSCTPLYEQTTGYTAVDMATAAAEGFRDGRDSVTVELPSPYPMPEIPEEAMDDSYMDAYHAAKNMRGACAEAIIAAGGKVKE